MVDKVFCPYCGSEMKPVIGDTLTNGYIATYSCPACKANSPRILGVRDQHDAENMARMLARSCTDMVKNRVLTLEEVTGSEEPCVFLESKHLKPIWAVDCVIAPDCKSIQVEYIHSNTNYKGCDDYGKTWRCWAHRPTDEERAAVPWEV